jgi:hypothetical protein
VGILIFSCLFAGWGDHKETHGWLRTREDMSGVPLEFIFYEIVRKRNFSSSQRHIAPTSSTLSLQHSIAVHSLDSCFQFILSSPTQQFQNKAHLFSICTTAQNFYFILSLQWKQLYRSGHNWLEGSMCVKLKGIRMMQIKRKKREWIFALSREVVRGGKERRRPFCQETTGGFMLLARIEVLAAHYLVENKFPWRPTHVLSSAGTLVLLIALPAKQT